MYKHFQLKGKNDGKMMIAFASSRALVFGRNGAPTEAFPPTAKS